MTDPNQSFRLVPGTSNGAYKKNGELNKAVRNIIKPNIVNINLPKDIKVFKAIKGIITFKSYAIIGFKTSCVYLAEHNQLKKRLDFLESTAFLKVNKLVKRAKSSALEKIVFVSFLLLYFIILKSFN